MARANKKYIDSVKKKIKTMRQDHAISYVRGALFLKINIETENMLREILHDLRQPEEKVSEPETETGEITIDDLFET